MMLDVKTLNVYYGKIHALKDVSFSVNEGEVVAPGGGVAALRQARRRAARERQKGDKGEQTGENSFGGHLAYPLCIENNNG